MTDVTDGEIKAIDEFMRMIQIFSRPVPGLVVPPPPPMPAPPAATVAPATARRRRRKPSLARARKRADKAGLHIVGEAQHPDGTIELRYGEKPAKANGNGSPVIETPEDLRKLI
jgi:hypothetical protein